MSSARSHPTWAMLLLALASASLLAGCAGVTRPPPTTPSPRTPETTPASPEVAGPPPPARTSPPEQETVAPPPPPPEPARVIDPAAEPVVQLLARQMRVPTDVIEVVQVARADWPNSCLGLPAEGELCATMITPGHAVSVVLNDQRYEFRTDESGQRIRLAFAPRGETGEALVTWRDAASFDVLVIGTQRVSFGLRGRPLLVAPLPVPERAPELVGFLSRFAPFYARTPAGEVSFRGVGKATATAMEQRQIAAWASLVSTEAREGRDTRMIDRAFVWRRTGGIAGFCDEVVVSRAGLAAAYSCRSESREPAAVVGLDPAELTEFFRWLDTYAPADWIVEGEGAPADGMTIELSLAGHGNARAPEGERERMLEFAHSLVRRLVTAGTNGTP